MPIHRCDNPSRLFPCLPPGVDGRPGKVEPHSDGEEVSRLDEGVTFDELLGVQAKHRERGFHRQHLRQGRPRCLLQSGQGQCSASWVGCVTLK